MNALTKGQLAFILDSILYQFLQAVKNEVEGDPEEKVKSLSRFEECVDILRKEEGAVTFEEFDELLSLVVDMYYQEDYTDEEVDFMNLPPSSPYIH
ncbi:hypothetical protein 015DV002_47 [Bacillus phage 015DV002]|nr:hypothetical protein 015DV002_47 [Bacillus phage 015DV002]QQO41277.1 hypothetical protein 015DV004_61 [Bacillus phage 015DV004]